MSAANLSRRAFLRGTAMAGGVLVVGFLLPGCSEPGLPLARLDGDWVPNAFLQFTPDGVVRFFCPRSEMGQGVTTGLTTLMAEELDFAPERMQIELASAHPDYVNPDFGVQATGGSSAIKAHWLPLRQVGADTRMLLLQAASAQTGASLSELSTDDGHVLHGTHRIPYVDLLETAAGMPMPSESPLKPASEFRWIGKDAPRLDSLPKATGTAVYGIDVDVPGMHHAVVVRSPVFGGSVASVDSAPALAVDGVTDVLEIDTGVAVVATSYWQARKGAQALAVEWQGGESADVSSASVRADYESATDDDGNEAHAEGDFGGAFAAASDTLEATWWAPYLAHAPMEPMNAVAHVRADSAEVWAGTQGPGPTQGLVARHADLDPEQVTVHQTWLGGGFGRRGTIRYVAEATQISKATGKPVKVLWSREDDLRAGLYRPASLMRIRAGLDADGRISAWEAKRVGGNITPDTLENVLPAVLPGAPQGVIDAAVGLADKATRDWVVDNASIEGFYEDYDLPNFSVRHVTRDHGVPLTFWRSVGHSYTAFAKETAMDELAERAGQDPVAFRVAHLQGNPRLRNVVEVAAREMAGMATAPGRHLGFAAHGSFFTDVAEVAEVSVENGRIRVHEVLCVVDCGTAVNPDVIRAQMEGAIMFGLTAALEGEIEIEAGAVKQSNFHDYPILRMTEAPKVRVVIIDSQDAPTGVGEPGLPPIAPAVANAVYRATGQRLRAMPLAKALQA